MDQKQFELLQANVQWVMDDYRRLMRNETTTERHHYQGTWVSGVTTDEEVRSQTGQVYQTVCGTACCFAGNAVILNGDRILAPADYPQRTVRPIAAVHCMDEDGVVHTIRERATHLMGLTFGQANVMFDAGATAPRLVSYSKEVARRNDFNLEVI